MTTFAHVETGQALDCQINETRAEYMARYQGVDTSSWTVVVAPDDTEHNATATPNAAGGYNFTNPVNTRVPQPVVMTKAQFQQYAYSQLGAVGDPSGAAAHQAMAGITRYGAIMLAIKASSDPATAAALDVYTNNDNFDFPYVTTFLSIVGPAPGSAITTAQENAAIFGNWPTQ